MGLVSGGVLVLSLWSLKRHTREIRLGIGLASVVLAIVILPACGGGSSSSGGGGGGGFNGTTPGSYTVTVNAFTESSSDASVPDAKTTFNLTVN